MMSTISYDRDATPEGDTSDPETHEDIWVDRERVCCHDSCDDNDDIIHSIISRTEPDSSDIETRILILREEEGRDYIYHECEESYSCHDGTIWHPSDRESINNPAKYHPSSHDHDPSLDLTEECLHSIWLIERVYTTEIVDPIEEEIECIEDEATRSWEYTRDNLDGSHRYIARSCKSECMFEFGILSHRQLFFRI
jgi:hypothetical protein